MIAFDFHDHGSRFRPRPGHIRIIAALSLLACTTVSADNLIDNPSFKNGYDDWDVELGAEVLSSSLVIEGWESPEDIHVKDDKAVQCVPLSGAQEYGIYARFRQTTVARNPYANRLNVVWKESRNCSDGGQWGGYLQPRPDTGWQRLGPKTLRPMLNAQAAEISITQRNATPADGDVFWDDIIFEPAEQPNLYTNLLVNPGFERGLTKWRWSTLKSQWIEDSGRSGTGAVEVETGSVTPNAASGSFNQCVSLGKRSRFTAAISFRRDDRSTADGSARFRLIWYSEPGCRGLSRISTESAQPRPNDFQWQRLTIQEVDAAPGAQSVTVEAIQTVTGDGNHVVFWDDAYLAAVPVDQSTQAADD